VVRYHRFCGINLQEQNLRQRGGPILCFADGQSQFDGSIFKAFRITERSALQFRADFFNAFNHPDFSTPRAPRWAAVTNGKITATSIDGRRMQFGLRLSFLAEDRCDGGLTLLLAR